MELPKGGRLDSIDCDMIARLFEKCCISNAMDKTEDERLFVEFVDGKQDCDLKTLSTLKQCCQTTIGMTLTKTI